MPEPFLCVSSFFSSSCPTCFFRFPWNTTGAGIFGVFWRQGIASFREQIFIPAAAWGWGTPGRLFFSVFFAPFALIGKAGIPFAQCVWYCLCAVLFFMIVQAWCRLFYGKSPAWFKQIEPFSLYDNRIIVPLVLVTGPLLSNFVELQVNVLMLFFVSMGLLAIRNEREWKAGFWLGLATAVKAYPAVFAVWLIYRKRWTALAGMAAWAAALTFLPFFRFGLDGPWVTFKRWLDISAGGAYPLTCGNQSVYAALARWILFDWQTMIRVKLVSPSAGDWGCRLASALFVLLFVLSLAVFVFLARKKRFQSIAVEGSIFCVLMVLFSPIAWKHYWTMTFPA